MGIFRAAAAFFNAAAAFLAILPVLKIQEAEKEIGDYDDEIETLGRSGTADDKLRIEYVSRRRRRAEERLRALRSAYDNALGRD